MHKHVDAIYQILRHSGDQSIVSIRTALFEKYRVVVNSEPQGKFNFMVEIFAAEGGGTKFISKIKDNIQSINGNYDEIIDSPPDLIALRIWPVATVKKSASIRVIGYGDRDEAAKDGNIQLVSP